MSDKTKSSVNLLHSNRFKFVLKDLPTVELLLTDFATPNLVYSINKVNYRQHYTNVGTDKVEVGDASVTFKVDSDLDNYIEIFNWVKSIGKQHSYEDRRELERRISLNGKSKNEHIIGREASLFFLDNYMNPNVEMTFVNLIPISLSGISLSTKQSGDLTMEATITFSVENFDIKPLKPE